MKPGTRLLQRTLAAEMGVSPTPVREALQQLRAQGFVHIDGHKGATVVLRSEAQIREIYDIRIALESLAAVRAAEALTDADYAKLRGLQERLRAASTTQQRVAANDLFHRTLYERANMPELSRLIQELRERVAPYLTEAYSRIVESEEHLLEHDTILEACKSRRPRRIESAVSTHLGSTAAMAIASLDEHGSEVG